MLGFCHDHRRGSASCPIAESWVWDHLIAKALALFASKLANRPLPLSQPSFRRLKCAEQISDTVGDPEAAFGFWIAAFQIFPPFFRIAAEILARDFLQGEHGPTL